MVTPPSGMYGRELREIGAHIGDEVDAHGEELAVLVHGDLGHRDIVPAMSVAEEMLGALAGPFDGHAEALRRDRRQRILVIAEEFRAEAAAHVGRDHADALGVDLEHVLGR